MDSRFFCALCLASMRRVRNLVLMNTQRWQESTTGHESVDTDAGVIRGVKVLGLRSKNGRRYLLEAAEAAKPLYEAIKVFIDHSKPGAPKTRSMRERWGRLVNVAIKEDGLYGDLEYLKTHPLTASILESIERFGDFGLSHDAEGVVGKQVKESVVTQIRKVFSVDVVTNPATNTNLFEGTEDMSKQKLAVVLRENIKDAVASDLLARLVEADGIDVEAVEIELAEGCDPVRECLNGAVLSIVEDASSTDGMLSSLRQALGVKPEIVKVTEGSDDRVTALEAEISALKEANELAATQASCRELLESKNREVSDVRLQALVALPAESRTLLVESWAEVAKRPEASPGRINTPPKDESIPESFEDFRKAISS